MATPDVTDAELSYHLKRSFTAGDSNYDAQLLYARNLFLQGEAESRAAFATLGKAQVSPQVKNRLLYPLEGKRFTGSIWRLEATHGFLTRDGMGDTVFMHVSNVQAGIWKLLANGDKVAFSLAFTFKGPAAFDIVNASALAPGPGQLDLLLAAVPKTT